MGWQRHLTHQGPDKSTELTSHGNDGFLPEEPTLHQSPEAAIEPGLCLPAQLLDRLRLMFLAFTEFFAHLGRQGIMLSALDQEPTRMSVAAFGDRSPALGIAAALFTAN